MIESSERRTEEPCPVCKAVPFDGHVCEDELLKRIRLLEGRLAEATEALRGEIERVCECDGEGVIDVERSPFDHGADAYNGAGDVITDYFDCPCVPLREALRAEPAKDDLYDAFCAWYEEHEIASDVERRLADTLALHLGIGQLAHPAPLDRGDKS